jgi:hypothetical protein
VPHRRANPRVHFPWPNLSCIWPDLEAWNRCQSGSPSVRTCGTRVSPASVIGTYVAKPGAGADTDLEVPV